MIVVGLGNPGAQYENTLHNIGFKVLELLAEKHDWSWKTEKKFQIELAKGTLKSKEYHLLKPQTYMNLSGNAVRSYLDYFQLPSNALIVVADDADLPSGKLRFKPFGGAGGHNGLKNLMMTLGTSQFKQLRIGIGRSTNFMSLADYVLAQQSEEVWKALEKSVEQACLGLESLAQESFEAVMKIINSGDNQ